MKATTTRSAGKNVLNVATKKIYQYKLAATAIQTLEGLITNSMAVETATRFIRLTMMSYNKANLYSPHDLLPAPIPAEDRPEDDYFYNEVLKHLIPDTVRIMMNGIPIDLDKVKQLEVVLDEVLLEVSDTLQTNPVIHKFQLEQHKTLKANFVKDRTSKMKPPDHFIKEFKHSNMDHRSYFMKVFCDSHPDISPPSELTATGIPKWPAKTVRIISERYAVLKRLLDGSIAKSNKYVVAAMQTLAEDKAAIHNKRYVEAVANCDELELPPFNPASPDQKHLLLTGMLGLESDKLSDTYKEYERNYKNAKRYNKPTDQLKVPKNKYSWDRDNVEKVNKETTDDDISNFTQAFIDHSFSAIVKNNFIKAFYDYTVDNKLYGNYKLFGAKSMRFTSNSPNMLNMPSTKSIYSKPIKKCFVAPPGCVVLAIDYSALEDRVIASLTKDTNKCSVFLDGLDGHCLNAYGYFKEEVGQHMQLTGDTVTDVKEFFRLCEEGHAELKAIRQKGKPAEQTWPV